MHILLKLSKQLKAELAAAFFFALCSIATFSPAADDGLGSHMAGDEPIEITSRQLEADGAVRKVRFIGDVVAKQGDVKLYAPEMVLFYDQQRQGIERMEALSGLRVVQGARTAQANKGVFFAKEEKIVLTGSARVTKGESYLEGDEITYFLNGEKSICKSREGGQVKAVFFPKKEKE
jgi:lipopolysaccharide export system protein LptA